MWVGEACSVPFGGISRTAIWRTGVAGINVPDAPSGRIGGAVINIVLPGLAFVWRLPKTTHLQCSGARKVYFFECRELRRSRSTEIPILYTFTRHRGKRARARPPNAQSVIFQLPPLPPPNCTPPHTNLVPRHAPTPGQVASPQAN